MKCLVTGGCGFIGTHLVESLVEDGHEVVIVDNLSCAESRSRPSPENAHLVVEDVRSQPGMEKLMKAEMPDVVFHLAAVVGGQHGLDDAFEDMSVNLGGSVSVLEAMRKAGVGHIVYTSSVAIYGKPVEMPMTEEHPRVPVTPYGVSKLGVHEYLKLFEREHGFRWSSLALANVYGIRGRYVTNIFFEQVLKGEPIRVFGDGEQERDFVFIDDVVDALRMMADLRLSGEFNLGTGVGTSVNELARLVQDIAGKEVPVVREEGRSFDVKYSRLSHEKLSWTTGGWMPRTTLREGLAKIWRDVNE